MRSYILYSALLTAFLSTVGLLATPDQALAERYSSPSRDDSRDNTSYRSRPDRPRFDRRRDNRDHDGRRSWSKPPRHPSRDRSGYRYYDRPWYKYPRYRHYPRYRRFYYNDDLWGWLAFTAITLAIIDSLNEQQQREHELVLYEALRAPVGETIRWSDQSASGSVTVIREGTSSAGRYCREYTQQIRINGESQRAYGTACRNPDGSWEILD